MEKEETQKTSKVENSKTSKMRQEDGKIKVPRNYLLVAGIVVIVLVAGFLFYQSYDFSNAEVAAVVNGEVITMDELNKAYDTLPAQYNGVVTKEKLLEQLVQAKVIFQEAEDEGITVTNEEAKQQFEAMKLSAGVTEEQFAASLQAQGVTEEQLVEQYGKQLTIQKYLDVKLLNNIQVSEEEVATYYSENPEKFQKKESVVVRHILIGDENKTAEENHVEAARILKELTKENFCEKVKEYTTDVASAETCGEYAFTKSDPLVPEFIELSFKQNKGAMGIADTQFGSHIIWTVDKLLARTVSLEESRKQIEEFLKAEKAKTEYEGFYQTLAADQKIELKFKEA